MNCLKHQKWLVGVSGGSDSMALLHMCVEAGVEVCVAHVNYQKRESADRDMKGVKAFCEERNIPCFVMLVDSYEEKVNFQKQARDIRYRFYKEVIDKNDCAGVLVAHHKDDVLETYLMQKEAKRIPNYYGICEDVILYGIHVKRPLLNYTKKDLEKYCEEHGITYYEDESNFSDVYQRNRIRHHSIEKMSLEEKDKLIEEIKEENQRLLEEEKEVSLFIESHSQRIALHAFLELSASLQRKVLRAFLLKHTGLSDVRMKALEDMISMIEHHKKSNQRHTINDVFDLVLEYGWIFVEKKKEVQSFSYVMERLQFFETPYFKVAKEGKVIEGVSVSEEDFPLTIRSAKMKDEIKLRLGTKKVRRFFIDNKITHKDREIWPVVENKDGIVIFVCGIGCDINHYSNNSSFFVLK